MVQRDSMDSTVTIPFRQTFKQLEKVEGNTQPVAAFNLPNEQPKDAQNLCGCGWPHHMLVPRGMAGAGMQFVLFVMATNWREDRVQSPSAGWRNTRVPPPSGTKHRLYVAQ